MNVEVRHFVPGRLRLHIPELFRTGLVPEQILQRLTMPGAIRKIRSNRGCASVVIEYDRDVPGPIADLVRTLRARSAQHVLDAPRDGEEGNLPVAQPSPDTNIDGTSRKWPLAAPTLSLALAFVSGP